MIIIFIKKQTFLYKNFYRKKRLKFEEIENNEIFKLNIGGKKYMFRNESILYCREANSLLELLIKSDHSKRLLYVNDYCKKLNEYYLERNSKIAEIVMDYFLTGV